MKFGDNAKYNKRNNTASKDYNKWSTLGKTQQRISDFQFSPQKITN